MLASHNESEIWGEGLFLFLGHYSSNNFSATFGSLMAPGLSLLVFPASASSDYSQPVCSHPGSDAFSVQSTEVLYSEGKSFLHVL